MLRRGGGLAGVLLALGCTSTIGDGAFTPDPGADPGGSVDPSDPAPPAPSGASGLPCDVEAVFASRCLSCHSDPPAQGVPVSLASYDDLAATSTIDPSASNAARSLARMRGIPSIMPPEPIAPVPPAEIAIVEAWIAGGMPRGSCADAPVDTPFDDAPTCTSGMTYVDGEGPLMHPGGACIACHQQDEGPGLLVGGTVYATGHEPDDCYGAAGAVVEITDANGAGVVLEVNAAGNFLLEEGEAVLVFPIRATVRFDGRERAMLTPQASGDCNACHTQEGVEMAPGRVALP